jgi:hypothetical protein
MSAFEQFLRDNPKMADEPYGAAMAETLNKAFPCGAQKSSGVRGKGPAPKGVGTGPSAPQRIEVRGATSRIVRFLQRNANSTKLQSRSQKKPRAERPDAGQYALVWDGRKSRARRNSPYSCYNLQASSTNAEAFWLDV